MSDEHCTRRWIYLRPAFAWAWGGAAVGWLAVMADLIPIAKSTIGPLLFIASPIFGLALFGLSRLWSMATPGYSPDRPHGR